MESSGQRTGQTIGHFFIDKKLGEGGMGAVYSGEDLTLSRRVAIKFLNRHQFTQQGNEKIREAMEQRFIREAKSAAVINHPNIAQIYEANFDSDDWYIAMEYIDGSSLFDRLISGQRFSVNEIVDICRQAITGLDYAWGKYKIIHRDIKPHNIMLNNENQVKIVDLGLAKPLENDFEDFELPELTNVGTPVGTPQYMAPEQASGTKGVNFLVDVYAMGATLYELCTGKKAFDAKTAPLIYMDQIQKKYHPIHQLTAEFPDSLVDLIDSMLEPEPERRVPSYTEILKILGKCVSSTTTEIRYETNESSSFQCPNCLSGFSVSTDDFDGGIECPKCQSILEFSKQASSIPPKKDESDRTKSANVSVIESLNSGERTLLAEEYGVDLQKIKSLKRGQCWEFAMIAEILTLQKEVLIPSSMDAQKNLVQRSGWKQERGRYYSFIKEHFQEYCTLQKELCNLMGNDLGYVLDSDDVNTIFSFANKTQDLISRFQKFQQRVLTEPIPQDRFSIEIQRLLANQFSGWMRNKFFRNSLPKDDQHFRLHRILCGWIPYCSELLTKIIAILKQHGVKNRGSEKFNFQDSFVPPTLYESFFIAKTLEIGFPKSKSVKANLLKD